MLLLLILCLLLLLLLFLLLLVVVPQLTCPSFFSQYLHHQVCGTNIVAWLNAPHPKVHEGIVNAEICFEWGNGPCQHKMQSQVRDIGN